MPQGIPIYLNNEKPIDLMKQINNNDKKGSQSSRNLITDHLTNTPKKNTVPGRKTANRRSDIFPKESSNQTSTKKGT